MQILRLQDSRDLEFRMIGTVITHLQIFGIGFSFGIAGPCLLLCTPVIVAYAAASHRNWIATLSNIFVFLSGRLFAYMVLGYLAGFSGTVLRITLSVSRWWLWCG